MTTLLGILLGLLILSIMMFVHELGHFLAGRALGFKIISFNMFMGPVLYQKKGKDGVTYTIRLIPMGASVEFAGEDSGINELPEDASEEEIAAAKFDKDDPGLFYNRPRWARAIVIAMGPIVNFITAFLAFCILFFSSGVQVPIVDELAPDSIAEKSGMQVGDRILEINGKKISSLMDISMTSMLKPKEVDHYLVQTKSGEQKELSFEKVRKESYMLGIIYDPVAEGSITVKNVDPSSNGGEPVLEAGDKILSINGISTTEKQALEQLEDLDDTDLLKLEVIRDGEPIDLQMHLTKFVGYEPNGYSLAYAKNFAETIGQAAVYPVSVIRSTFSGLEMIFSGQLKAKDGLTGPVGIVAMVGNVVKEESIDTSVKVQELLRLFALISVAVGFTNLLPIPPFDGFQLLVLAIEGTIRKDIPEKIKEGFALVGICLMLLLVAYVFYIDISRIFF